MELTAEWVVEKIACDFFNNSEYLIMNSYGVFALQKLVKQPVWVATQSLAGSWGATPSGAGERKGVWGKGNPRFRSRG
ncbi:MAG: hypothetical protein K2H67_05200, partial [Treponemataceae bacterium]|nr:hypothetical protein [Treponemataceae bacterium]